MSTTEILITAGTALAGALVGGGATIAGQVLTNRGTAKREREAREHAFMIKRHEIERDTLLALQDMLVEHYKTSIAAQHAQLARHSGDTVKNTTAIRDDYNRTHRELVKLSTRILDRRAAEAVMRFADCSRDVVTDHQNPQRSVDAREAFPEAQERVGEAIRQLPNFAT